MSLCHIGSCSISLSITYLQRVNFSAKIVFAIYFQHPLEKLLFQVENRVQNNFEASLGNKANDPTFSKLWRDMFRAIRKELGKSDQSGAVPHLSMNKGRGYFYKGRFERVKDF